MPSLNNFTVAAAIIIFIFGIQRAFARPTNEELRGKYQFFSWNETAKRNHSTWDPFPYISSLFDFVGEEFENHTKRFPTNVSSEIPTTITAISDKTESIENNTNIAGPFEAIVAFPTTSRAIITNNETVSIFDDFTSVAVTTASPTSNNTPSTSIEKETSAAVNAFTTERLGVTTEFLDTGNVTLLDNRSESSADNLTTTEMPKTVTIIDRKDLNQNKSTAGIDNETTTENFIATVVTIGDATTINNNETENLADDTLTAKSNVNSPSSINATDRATTITTGHSLLSVTITKENASITTVKSDTTFTGITELIDNEVTTEKSVVTVLTTGHATRINNNETELLAEETATEKSNLINPSSINAFDRGITELIDNEATTGKSVVTGNATTVSNNETEFLTEDTTSEKSNLTSSSSINASESDYETNMKINKIEAMGNTSITSITPVKLETDVTLSYTESTADETNTTRNVSFLLPLNSSYEVSDIFFSKVDGNDSSSVESSESEEIELHSRLNSKNSYML